MASLPCPALPSIIFSDGKTLLLGGTPGMGALDLGALRGFGKSGVGPTRGAGKYLFPLVTDYSSSSQFVRHSRESAF